MKNRIPIEYYEELAKRVNYNPETGEFTWKSSNSNKVKIGDKAGSVCRVRGYLYIGCKLDCGKRRAILGHRLAWYMYHRDLAYQIDHIDGDKINNSISNLRVCTQEQNTKNCSLSSRNKSGYKGVSKGYKGKWIAYIGLDSKTKHLGTFKTKKEAVGARDCAEKKYYGEFSPLLCRKLEVFSDDK